MLVILSWTVPVLVRVATWGGPLMPTASLGKVRDDGEIVTVGAGVPVPDKLTICGLMRSPSVMVIVPFQVSARVGVKVTEMVQVAPAFTVVPQVLVSPKDLLATMLVMLREFLPKFVRVMD